MSINKLSIEGTKGVTVCYSIPNITFTNNHLTWDTFKFYTPLGTQSDTEGNNYFDVLALDELINRDDTLNKDVYVIVTASGIEIIEILEGEQYSMSIGMEGDWVCRLIVPSDTGQEILVEYKEVTDG